MDHYKFRLYVETPGHKEHATWFEVPAYCAEQFKAYDLCTDAATAILAGGVTASSAARIDLEREKLAADIAHKLTAAIMESIKGRDLRNGYKQDASATKDRP